MASGAGMPSQYRTSPYFSTSSSNGPKSKARSGQLAVHAGCMPSARRSTHMVHLLIFVPGSSEAKRGAP